MYQSIYCYVRFGIKLNKKTRLSVEKAESCLNAYHTQSAPAFSRTNAIQKDYDLMIVIPVYNVEAYLKECLDSVFAQETRYRFCVVAVDDGSTDVSGAILDGYASCENLTIIHQKNKGLSGARNTALKNMNARYVMFLDSDDYLPGNTIECLMEAACKYDADIVQGGYREFTGERTLQKVVPLAETGLISREKITGFACMKIIRSEILRNFCFPEGFLYEDTVMSKLLYPACSTAVSVPDMVYCYRLHEKSISGGGQTAKNVDTFWITKYCLEEAARRGYALDAVQYKQYLQQCRVNFIRTRYLPEEIQESIFVLTRELFARHFPNQRAPEERKYRMLHRAFRVNSYEAYLFVLRRWDVF